MNRLVWRLIRKNISSAQVAAYFIAFLCGVTLVMLALQFRHDASAWLNPQSSAPQEFITVSKKVSRSGFGDNTFSQEEIAKLRSQSWADTVAPYLSGSFSVLLSIDLGAPLSTSMFLEGVPDCFLDTVPAQWDYIPGSNTVPLIIPRDYLTLYNYGFAATRSLPVLSESTISRLPLTLTISGNGNSRRYRARIAGFSSRINSVIAPEEFIREANAQFGDGTVPPTRLIIKTYGDSEQISSYLEANRMERSGEGVDTSLLTSAVTLLTTLLITVGAIIIALSLIIQLLCLYLLVVKNQATTSRLILLGYSPASLRLYYLTFITASNLLTLAVASLLTPVASTLWQNIIPASPFTPVPYLAGATIVFLLTLPVIPMLRRSIR